MEKRLCVTYYCADRNKVLTKECIDLKELEFFRRYLAMHKGLDELNAFEFTLLKIDSIKCVYDIRKL